MRQAATSTNIASTVEINSTASNQEHYAAPISLAQTLPVNASASNSPQILSDIYQPQTNISIWQRSLDNELTQAIAEIIATSKRIKIVEAVNVDTVAKKLKNKLGSSDSVQRLSDDAALLVDMFSCLFEINEVGLRLTALDSPMCPRFHFDRIPCRLVTTYQGAATQWLAQDKINRQKIGVNQQGLTDEESGLFQSMNDIQQLNQGDVALLKGEYWYNNEGAGIVHRSPPVSVNERRLLLTLDFIND